MNERLLNTEVMMKKLPTTILFLMISTTSSFAASYYPTTENECSTVDFRQTFPMKIRDQGKSSWCFANAAADYLQYAYHLDEQISAADIAIGYSQTKISKLIHFFQGIFDKSSRTIPAQTGLIKFAVNNIVPQGYCPESALPSGAWNQVAADGTESQVEIIKSLRDTADLQGQIKSGKIASSADLPHYYKFKNINRDQFFDVLKESTKNSLFTNLRAAACKNERKPFGSTVLSSDFQIRGKHIFKNMNYSFDHQMPVTMDFFDDVYKHFDHPKRTLDEMHTVLLYGRRFDPATQQCTYMIKDSFGDQCTRFDPKLSCEHGYVWVPENKLFPFMTSQLVIYQN